VICVEVLEKSNPPPIYPDEYGYLKDRILGGKKSKLPNPRARVTAAANSGRANPYIGALHKNGEVVPGNQACRVLFGAMT
jgi:hypothetical protein